MKASNQQFEIGLGTLGTSKIIQTGSDYQVIKLTKKKAKTYHQVKIEFLTWYISLKVEAASSRVGTHDLSPIFQSVSHAYQLCNKVSKEPHVLNFFCAGSTTLVQEKKKSFWAKNAHSIPNSKDTKTYLGVYYYVFMVDFTTARP